MLGKRIAKGSQLGWGVWGAVLAIVLVGSWAAWAQDAAAPPASTAPAANGQQNMLVWFLGALGWKYCIAFAALSFTFVALIIMNVLALRRTSIIPPALVEQFQAHLDEKRYQEAYELAKADESFLGRVLSAGLGKLSAGYDHAIEAMNEVGADENMKLEHRLSYIALIGSLSPMVGLLGTVNGMVDSFMVIANSTSAPKPSELAAGISTALITTLVGLVLAIPAIGLFGIYKNRLSRYTLEVGIISEGLMSRFQAFGGKKA